MKHITELRDELSKAFFALKGGTMSAETALSLAKIGNSIVNTVKVECKVFESAGQPIDIPFINRQE